jgi:hypothetical protein
MTSAPLFRRASLALAAFTLACGDSTGPRTTLTDEQAADMLEAMSSVASIGALPGTSMAVINASQTVDCPNGGSTSLSSSVNENQAAGTATIQVIQGFSGCRATSRKGRIWTFDGDPNVVTNISVSYNQTTGAFSLTGSQVGGVRFASDLGSGSCRIDLSFTLSGDASSIAGTLSGTACGHNIEQSISVTQ